MIVAANILGEPREATLRGGAARHLHRSTGRRRRRHRGQVQRDRAPVVPPSDSGGYLTLLSDGERLTGAHALGPEAGEWLQQAAPAIHARVFFDTIEPLPTFSEMYLAALKALRDELATAAGSS